MTPIENLQLALSTPWVVALIVVAVLTAIYDYDQPGWQWSLIAVPFAIAAMAVTLCPWFGLLTVIWCFEMLGRIVDGGRK